MSFMCRTLTRLKRPKLLIQAARHGVHSYRRARDLRRLIPGMPQSRPDEILESLALQEHYHNEARQTDDTSYSLTRHVALLSALLAEMRETPQA